MQKTTFQLPICHLLHLKRWHITPLNVAYRKAKYIVFTSQMIIDINTKVRFMKLFI